MMKFASALVLFTSLSLSVLGYADDGQNSALTKQRTDFHHILYAYFQDDFLTVLGLIDQANDAHLFSALSEEDKDRLSLMQGAAQLNLGLYTKAQANFLGLLDKTTSDYVQAQTWYWMAKAGFENRQQYLSEQAYAAILRDKLQNNLSFEQWQELTYLAAYSRMLSGGDWQSLYQSLHKSTIFPAYLKANEAVNLFNQASYAQASQVFAQAKQSLVTHKRAQSNVFAMAGELSREVLDVLSPWTWFSSDPNRLAQATQEKQEEDALLREQNALFDQINLYLGYTLLKQQDDENALAVIQQVSHEDGEAQQALLTMGWALAQQNRWQAAMQTWQYLADSEQGLYQLQASYALDYAHQQMGDFGQAYFALDTTVNQIEQGLISLRAFQQQLLAPAFFDEFNDAWPKELIDIKRSFLTGSDEQGRFDASYFLSLRNQAREILKVLEHKQTQIDTLASMLQERELSFIKRKNALSLREGQGQLTQAAQDLQRLQAVLAPQDEAAKQALMRQMLSKPFQQKYARLEEALARHQRLLEDPPRGRPLKASYAERLHRLQGILQWHMHDAYIKNQWRHQRLLKHAEAVYAQAKSSFASVQNAQSSDPGFAKDRARIQALQGEIDTRRQQAQALFKTADTELSTFLNRIVEARIAALEDQWVNTRLARIRLQDMQGSLDSEDLMPSSNTQGAKP